MCIRDSPKTIMSSYNLVNGTYANENAHLLQDILRRDWGCLLYTSSYALPELSHPGF